MNKEEAFEIINNQEYDIPFEAIEYLYKHPKDEDINKAIVFALENAYNSYVYGKKENYSHAPLWYAIVAENHLDESLIRPIIDLFTDSGDSDWDYLNEQLAYVLESLCKEIGTPAVDRFIAAIDQCFANPEDSEDSAFIYLFNAINYADHDKHLPKYLKWLENPNTPWLDALLGQFGESGIYAVKPRLEELKEYYTNDPDSLYKKNYILPEINYSLDVLNGKKERGKTDYEDREDWKIHYSSEYLINSFAKPQPKKPIVKKKKIGRNDPCPCGSGKKYKKCCL
jgi:hypothetical protein